jgi:hypothetical protein
VNPLFNTNDYITVDDNGDYNLAVKSTYNSVRKEYLHKIVGFWWGVNGGKGLKLMVLIRGYGKNCDIFQNLAKMKYKVKYSP